MISIKAELAAKNYKYIDAARKVGMPSQTFYRKLRKNTFTLEEAEKIMALVEKELVIVDRKVQS